jgi:hypothetical protein
MKLNLIYDNISLTTNITKDITIKELIHNIKSNIKTTNQNDIMIMNEEYKILDESEIINAKNEKERNLYVFSQIKPNKNEQEQQHEPLEDIIMKVTDAKTKLKIPKARRTFTLSPDNLLQQMLGGTILANSNNSGNLNVRGNQLSQLQNLLRTMMETENNIIINPINQVPLRIVREPVNNAPIIPDENLVNQLKEMGFPDDRCRRALILARNQIERASDILCSDALDYLPSDK